MLHLRQISGVATSVCWDPPWATVQTSIPSRLQDLWIGKDQGLSYRHLPEAERAAESFPLFDHLRGDLRFPAAIRADQTYPSPWVKR